MRCFKRKNILASEIPTESTFSVKKGATKGSDAMQQDLCLLGLYTFFYSAIR